MATLFTGLLGNDRDDWGKRLTVHRASYLCHSIAESLLCRSHLSVSICMRHKDLRILHTFAEKPLHSTSLHVFLTSFPIEFLPSLTIQLIHGYQPTNQGTVTFTRNRAISKPDLSLLFFSQLITGHTLRGCMCMLGEDIAMGAETIGK